eukprot:1392288-Amphidinium_carterae.1
MDWLSLSDQCGLKLGESCQTCGTRAACGSGLPGGSGGGGCGSSAFACTIMFVGCGNGGGGGGGTGVRVFSTMFGLAGGSATVCARGVG